MSEQLVLMKCSLPPVPFTPENLADIKMEFSGPLTVRHLELLILMMRDHLESHSKEGALLFAEDVAELAIKMMIGFDKSAAQLILED